MSTPTLPDATGAPEAPPLSPQAALRVRIIWLFAHGVTLVCLLSLIPATLNPASPFDQYATYAAAPVLTFLGYVLAYVVQVRAGLPVRAPRSHCCRCCPRPTAPS